MTDFKPSNSSEWSGSFNPETYAKARTILADDRQRVRDEIKAEGARRGRIVGIVAIVWAVCSVALAFANIEWLLIAEIGWVVIVFWAVFWLLPALMGRANIDDMYDQYADQLDKLEEAAIAMPEPSCIEELVAAIDLVSPAEE